MPYAFSWDRMVPFMTLVRGGRSSEKAITSFVSWLLTSNTRLAPTKQGFVRLQSRIPEMSTNSEIHTCHTFSRSICEARTRGVPKGFRHIDYMAPSRYPLLLTGRFPDNAIAISCRKQVYLCPKPPVLPHNISGFALFCPMNCFVREQILS